MTFEPIPVCAWISAGAYVNEIHRFDSISEAVDYFFNEFDGESDRGEWEIETSVTGNGPYTTRRWIPDLVMDLYPQCGECVPMENYHDYPMSRWQVGPRGGIRKVCV